MIETEVKYLIIKLPSNLPNPMYIEQRYFEPVNTLDKILKLFDLDSLENIPTRRIRLIKTDRISFVITLKRKGCILELNMKKKLVKNYIMKF